MPISLTSEIEAALATGSIHVVDAVRIDFGHGVTRKWASSTVSAKYVPDGPYDGRVISIAKLPFSVGAQSDDKSEILIDNTNGFFRKLIDKGLRINRARVAIIRLFPNLDPPNNAAGTWENPYWQGTISSYVLDGKVAKLEVAAGFLELSRRALRKYDSTCNNLFKDGLHCDYDPLAGHGLPEELHRGTATGGSATTLVDTAADFSDLTEGMLVLNLTDSSIGRVTTATTTTVTVSDFVNGSNNFFSALDQYLVGPEFSSCPLSKMACIDRGMFGPNDLQTAADLNLYHRRWFNGYLFPAAVPYLTRARSYDGKESKFRRTSHGNAGLDGESVPRIHGFFRRRDCDLLGLAVGDESQDRPFLETLWGVSAGRMSSLTSPLVDDFPPDDVNPDPGKAAVTQDSFITYNTMQHANDQGAVDSGELSEEQRQLGIASRESFLNAARRETSDSYSSNPFLFNSSTGDGVSWSELSMFRMRTQPHEVRDPRGSVQVGGSTRLPPAQSGLGVGGFASSPDPCQVWYDFARDTDGGAGLDDNQINLVDLVSASEICREKVANSQSILTRITGTVLIGPADGTNSSSEWNWFATETEIPDGLVGSTVNVQTAAGTASLVVDAVEQTFIDMVSDFGDSQLCGLNEEIQTGAGPIYVDCDLSSTSVYIVRTTESFTGPKLPTVDDTFTIDIEAGTSGGTVRRYKFNGILEGDLTVGEMLDSILLNCNGQTISHQGKISPVIPRPVSYATALGRTIYSDKGSLRNIIKGTVRWKPTPTQDSANVISVEFADRENGYLNTRRKVVDQPAQRFAAEAYSEKLREKEEKVLTLNGTSSLDQALRLAALVLRQKGFLPGNRENGILECVLPVQDAMQLKVFSDVHIIESDILPRYLPKLFRLVELIDNPDKLTMTTKWTPDFQAIYSDATDDVGVEPLPDPVKDPGKFRTLGPVLIESLTSTGFATPEGVFEERVQVKVTLLP